MTKEELVDIIMEEISNDPCDYTYFVEECVRQHLMSKPIEILMEEWQIKIWWGEKMIITSKIFETLNKKCPKIKINSESGAETMMLYILHRIVLEKKI